MFNFNCGSFAVDLFCKERASAVEERRVMLPNAVFIIGKRHLRPDFHVGDSLFQLFYNIASENDI